MVRKYRCGTRGGVLTWLRWRVLYDIQESAMIAVTPGRFAEGVFLNNSGIRQPKGEEMRKKLTELRQKWLNEAGLLWMSSYDSDRSPEDRSEARGMAMRAASCADELGKAMESEGA